MKYIKLFENTYVREYMVAEVSNHVDLHLLETIFSEKDGLIARTINPELSSTFRCSFINNERLSTEYGYIYNILYKTKDKDNAIYYYNIICDSKKYNL